MYGPFPLCNVEAVLAPLRAIKLVQPFYGMSGSKRITGPVFDGVARCANEVAAKGPHVLTPAVADCYTKTCWHVSQWKGVGVPPNGHHEAPSLRLGVVTSLTYRLREAQPGNRHSGNAATRFCEGCPGDSHLNDAIEP